jgi:hypothetical protein
MSHMFFILLVPKYEVNTNYEDRRCVVFLVPFTYSLLAPDIFLRDQSYCMQPAYPELQLFPVLHSKLYVTCPA